MSIAVHQAACHMENQMRSMDVVANNLANANTPGFRRMVSHFSTRHIDTQASDRTEATFPHIGMSHIDYTQGPFQRTGRELDVAINGEGFMAVETDDGLRLTRKGRMYMDRDGELRDASGNVFSADVGALQIPEEWSDLVIDSQGNVSADGEELGQLTLFSVPDRENLRSLGDGLYEYVGDNLEEDLDSELIQGAVEQSNVEPVNEMVNLIKASRSYEAGTRLLERIDRLEGAVINQSS